MTGTSHLKETDSEIQCTVFRQEMLKWTVHFLYYLWFSQMQGTLQLYHFSEVSSIVSKK